MARQCGMKFRIYPNKEQREQLSMFFDATRFVWNWFLAKKQEEKRQRCERCIVWGRRLHLWRNG